MFATSFHPRMNCIPVFEGKTIDWIPVDIAAATVTDVLLSASSSPPKRSDAKEQEKYSVHNIVNPRSIRWVELVSMLQDIGAKEGQGERMEEVSMAEWVKRLGKLADEGMNTDELPGLKLLQFFENMAEGREEESKLFETGKSREISQVLRECQSFCSEWVSQNLNKWKETGFLA
jgi:hypothetical protein